MQGSVESVGGSTGESYDDEFYESLSSLESGSKFVKVDLPVTSPSKAAQDAWNADKKTKLMRVDPEVHCLSVDGAIEKHDGGDFFVACASAKANSLGAGACTIGTHDKKGRPKLELSGPAYLVKVKPASMATKPEVLAGVMLLEEELPHYLVECGLGDLLQEFEAPPCVWKAVLEMYPGKEKMMTFSELPSRTEHSSQRSSRGGQSGAYPGRMSVTSASGHRSVVS